MTRTTLILMRHSKSCWNDDTLSDFDRPLNKRGLRDAPFMGERLNQANPLIEQVLCSSSLRTRQTWEHIRPQVDSVVEASFTTELYHVSADEILSYLLTQPVKVTLIIGHNPGLSSLVYRLSGKKIHHFPTSAWATFDLELESWSDLKKTSNFSAITQLVGYEYPKQFPSELRRTFEAQ